MIDPRALIPFWSHKEGHVYHRLVEKKQHRQGDRISDRSALVLLLGFFVVFVSLPVIFFASNQTKTSLAPSTPFAISTVHCPGQCLGDSANEQYIQGLICTTKKNNSCLTCGEDGKFTATPIGSCTTPDAHTITLGPAGSCDGANWDYHYTECCSEGTSRTISRVCRNGQFYWDQSPCTNGDSQCLQKSISTIVCPPGAANAEGKCYPIESCAPNCSAVACGASDGCGGVCVGTCTDQAAADRAIASGTLGGSYKFAYSALNFKNGFYTNICGDTLKATKSCTSGCNPSTGVCTSDKPYIVRWECDGKGIQCRENESAWKKTQSMGSVACGKTVAITMFSKNCRAGGPDTWGCGLAELLDYMVWYSGDCAARPTVTYTPTPTSNATPTPTATITPTSTPYVVYKYITKYVYATPSFTPMPTAGIGGAPIGGKGLAGSCNTACTYTSDCSSPFYCVRGLCRSGSCTDDATCSCAGFATSSATPSLTANGSGAGFGGLFGSPQVSSACNDRCTYPIDCPSGFTCVNSECRNATCPQNGNCACDAAANAIFTPTPSVTATAENGGGGVWMVILLIVIIVVVGVVAFKFFIPHT